MLTTHAYKHLHFMTSFYCVHEFKHIIIFIIFIHYMCTQRHYTEFSHCEQIIIAERFYFLHTGADMFHTSFTFYNIILRCFSNERDVYHILAKLLCYFPADSKIMYCNTLLAHIMYVNIIARYIIRQMNQMYNY